MARLAVAAAAFALVAQAGVAQAQSAGMAHLLHHNERTPAREAAAQREARQRAERHRAETASMDRARAADSNLSADERRRLRQNLYELSREMYSGS